MTHRISFPEHGPYRAEQITPDDNCELSHGHRIECLPSGSRNSKGNLMGASTVAWDPAVKDAGVDTGFSPEPGMLRAPDVAIGDIPDEPGWAPGVPLLALEYADTGQDESALAAKICDLLEMGTKYVWVVRLVGPRRVEVYTPKQPMRIVQPGELLRAPGVLKNPVPVEALYDREAAGEVTLTNLLQRKGYENLQGVLDEGKKLGLDEGKKLAAQIQRATLRDLCEAYGISLSAEQEASMASMDLDELQELREALVRLRRWPD